MSEAYRKRLPWEDSKHGGPLGRHVEHDPRSRRFQALVPAALVGTRKAVTWGRHAAPFDQGSLGSCTGNAVTGAAVTNPTYRRYHNYREPMAVKVYKRATVIDGFPGEYPPDDTGSSGLAACKAAVEYGLIGSYQHAFSVDQALDALQLRPVITGVSWYEGFDRPDSSGLVQIAGQVRGGHEFEVLGYDPGDGTPKGSFIRCCNSWGQWGDKGYFRMSIYTWATLLADYGDVTVPVK